MRNDQRIKMSFYFGLLYCGGSIQSGTGFDDIFAIQHEDVKSPYLDSYACATSYATKINFSIFIFLTPPKRRRLKTMCYHVWTWNWTRPKEKAKVPFYGRGFERKIEAEYLCQSFQRIDFDLKLIVFATLTRASPFRVDVINQNAILSRGVFVYSQGRVV